MAYDLTARLRVKDDGFTRGVDRATQSTKRLNAAAGQTDSAISRIANSAGGAGSVFQRMSSSAGAALTSLSGKAASAAKSIASIGAGTAAVAAVGAGAGIGALSKQALQLSSEAEQAGIAFETMLKSPEKAKEFQASIKQFAVDSPFDLKGVRTASQKMLAFGFASERVIPMLTTFSDTAAGLGLGSDGINRLTLAIGQMQAKGKVQGDELLQLTEAGIAALPMLAEAANVTTSAMSDMISQGLVPADKAIKVLLKGMDAQFGGLTEKQAKSLQGLYNGIKETFENDILVKWGDGLATALKPRLDKMRMWIDNNGATIERWGNTLSKVGESSMDALLKSFESGFAYVDKHFLSNPEFMQLPTLSAKIGFVYDDLLKTFNSWYDDKGRSAVERVTRSLTDTLISSVAQATGPLTEIGTKLGVGLAKGIASGVWSGSKNIPLLGSIFGAADDLGVGVGGLIDSYKSGGVSELFGQMYRNAAVSLSNTPSQQEATEQYLIGRQHDGSHSGGLDRVPYNGYRAILHKDERVQTKAEADQQRNGGGSGAGPITVNLTYNGSGGGTRADAQDLVRILTAELGAVMA
jgi:tape measure domain-containing protein